MLNKSYSTFLFSVILLFLPLLCLPVACFSVYSMVDISGRYIVVGLPLVLYIRPDSDSYWVEIRRGNREELHNVANAASNVLINPQWWQFVHIPSEGVLSPHLPQNQDDNKEKEGFKCCVDHCYMSRWVVDNNLELASSINFIMKFHSERRKVERDKKIEQDFYARIKEDFDFWESEAGKQTIANSISIDCFIRPTPEYQRPEFRGFSLRSGMAYSDIPIFSNNYIHLLTKQHADLLEHLVWIYQNSIDISFSIDDLNHELDQNQQSIHIELEEDNSQIIISIVISQHNRSLKITHTLILDEKGQYELKKVIVDDSNHDSYTLEQKEFEL